MAMDFFVQRSFKERCVVEPATQSLTEDGHTDEPAMLISASLKKTNTMSPNNLLQMPTQQLTPDDHRGTRFFYSQSHLDLCRAFFWLEQKAESALRCSRKDSRNEHRKHSCSEHTHTPGPTLAMCREKRAIPFPGAALSHDSGGGHSDVTLEDDASDSLGAWWRRTNKSRKICVALVLPGGGSLKNLHR